MQKLRAVVVALVATLVVSSGANAQRRNFDDSWFWGFKSGINTFSVPGHGNTSTVDLGQPRAARGVVGVAGEQAFVERNRTLLVTLVLSDDGQVLGRLPQRGLLVERALVVGDRVFGLALTLGDDAQVVVGFCQIRVGVARCSAITHNRNASAPPPIPR